MSTSHTTAAASSAADDPQTRLRRGAVGVVGILFFVLSAQAPLTAIAGALPVSIALGNGAGAPVTYVLVGAVMCLFAVGFIAMARHVKEAGAFSAYVGRGLGRRAGTGAGLLALTSYSTIQAAMYGLYGVTVSFLVQEYLGVSTPWWLWAVGTMALVQVLGSLNIELGARFLAVLVVAECGILAVFAVVTLFTGGGPEGLNPAASFSPNALMAGAPGIALTFAIASMFGFESTAIYSEEAKDPERTVPRATYAAIVVIAVFYTFVSWMIVSAYGAGTVQAEAGAALESGDATVLVFSVVGDSLGAWTGHVLGVLLATSLLAGILAFHNACNRYMHSLSHAGVLPSALRRTNRQDAPHVASMVQTGTALLLVLPFALTQQDPVLTLFSWFSGVAVLALVVLYVLTSVSVVVFFARTGLDTRRWNTVIAPVASAVLIAAGTVLVLSNFTLLIGGSASTAWPLVLSVPAVFLLGLALGGSSSLTADGADGGEPLSVPAQPEPTTSPLVQQ